MDLSGRVAVVTGAGGGLGREHALLLARLGARVVVNDLDSDSSRSSAERVVAEIREAGGEAVVHAGSVCEWDSAAKLVATALSTFGTLDVLVNNAGVLRDRPLASMSEAEWDAAVAVNLKGHFCPLRHAAAYWREESKAGRPRTASVINTTSGAGLRGNPLQANYASAKAGVAALTLVAARELDRYGVRVNAISPVARTRLTMATPGVAERMGPPKAEGFDDWSPANVSPLVAWLASSECTASGQVFSIRANRVERHQGWSVVESHQTSEAWTADELAAVFADLPAGASKAVLPV